jgi:FkbM family methyltransferase
MTGESTPDTRSGWLGLASRAARWLPAWMKKAVYRSPLLADWLRRRLNQAAPEGIQTVKIAAGLIQGMRMALDLHSEKYYWLGTYEPELQRAAEDWIRPGWVIYDIGANIGYVSLILAHLAGDTGKVYAFEALPENVQRLQRNLALNPHVQNIHVISAAVVEQSRQVHFWSGPSHKKGRVEGSAFYDSEPQGMMIEVEGISLDEYVPSHGLSHPELIKLDIEGGEVMALPGMRRLLEESRPVLFLELHGEESCQVAWNLFQDLGYSLRWMKAGYPTVNSFEDLGRKAYLVAVP